MSPRYHCKLQKMLTCPNCQCSQDVSLQSDGDGYYYELETERCSEPGCKVEACQNCPPNVECDGCGGSFCPAHITAYGELMLCSVCMTEAMATDPEVDAERDALYVGDELDALAEEIDAEVEGDRS